MSDEDAVARGMAFMNGFDENHPTLKGVAQVLGTSKLTRWPDASDYAGTGKYMYQAELAGVAVAVQVVPLHPPEDAGWKIERAQRRVSLLCQIHSPHVVRVLSDAVAVDGVPGAVCWVEELIPSESLESLTPQDQMWDVGQAYAMLVGVGAGVAEFHALGARAWPHLFSVRRRLSGEFAMVNSLFVFRLNFLTPDHPFPDFMFPHFVSPEDSPGGKPTLASDISGSAPPRLSPSQALCRSRVLLSPISPTTASPRSTQSCAPNKRRRYGHCAPTYPRDSPPSSTGACCETRSTVTRTQQRCSMTSFGTVSSRPGRTPCDALTRATSLRRVRWVPSQAGAGTCRAQD